MKTILALFVFSLALHLSPVRAENVPNFFPYGGIVAVAPLGEHDSVADLRAAPIYPRILSHYPEIADISTFSADQGGKQVFLIVPYDENVEIRGVTLAQRNDWQTDETLFENNGKALLLRSHAGKAFPDVGLIMQATDDAGKTVQLRYLPTLDDAQQLDLGDARINDQKIEAYQEGETLIAVQFTDVLPAEQRSNDYPGIDVKVEHGGVIVRIDPKHAEIEDFFPDTILDSEPHSVQGLSAPVKGVFISDIGQDINPILAILTEQNDVEILSIFDALRQKDWRSSGVLYKQIEGFAYFPYNPGYGGFLAVDREHREQEIELSLMFAYPEPYRYLDDQTGLEHRLYLSPDWKIHYQIAQGDTIQHDWHGHYRAVEEDYAQNIGVYRYIFPDKSGTFRIRINDDGELHIQAQDGELDFGDHAERPSRYSAEQG